MQVRVGPEILTTLSPGPAEPHIPPQGLPYPTGPLLLKTKSSAQECHGPRPSQSPLLPGEGLVPPELWVPNISSFLSPLQGVCSAYAVGVLQGHSGQSLSEGWGWSATRRGIQPLRGKMGKWGNVL